MSAPVTEQRHGHVVLEHALDQQPRAFAQPRGVVGEERPIDQVGGGLLAGDRRWIDARAGEVARGLFLQGRAPWWGLAFDGPAHDSLRRARRQTWRWGGLETYAAARTRPASILRVTAT